MNMNDPPPADDQLPIFDEEILWKIFGKSDPKTAGKCRAISKKWRMRLTNPLFAKHNFSENKHRNMQIVAFLARSGRGDECFSMVRVDMQTRQQCQGRLPESIRNFSSFQVIGSSNGLLCIKFILGTAHSELTVWNPLTRRRISTQDHSSKQKDFVVSQYAFGHIFDTLYYAILHVFKEKFADRTVHWSLYSSVTKNWNLKGSFEGTFEKLGPTYVVLKGVVYWIGWQGVAIPKPKCIVSFNLMNRAVVEEEIPQKAKSTFHTLSILKDEVAFISSFYEGQFTTVVDVYQVTRTGSSGSIWAKMFRTPAMTVPFTPTIFAGNFLLNVMESRSGPYNSNDAERTDLLIAKHDYEADRNTNLVSTSWTEIVHLRTISLHSPGIYPVE